MVEDRDGPVVTTMIIGIITMCRMSETTHIYDVMTQAQKKRRNNILKIFTMLKNFFFVAL